MNSQFYIYLHISLAGCSIYLYTVNYCKGKSLNLRFRINVQRIKNVYQFLESSVVKINTFTIYLNTERKIFKYLLSNFIDKY